MTWLRDVILIVLAAGLLVAVLWPASDEPDEGQESAPDEKNVDSGEASVEKALEAPLIPIENAVHPLFPVVAGVAWTYLVTGPPELCPADTWTMEIVAEPAGAEPGIVKMGFGDRRTEKPVWIEDGILRIGDMPFTAPFMYIDNEAESFDGKWLPPMQQIGDDSVWNYFRTRSLEYRSRNKKREVVVEKAVGNQVDRATAKALGKIIVPAGVFEARKVSWLSRIEIRAGKSGRRVLAHLTTEPYRKETTWFAQGVGMVRRRVTYQAPQEKDIIFDLVRFQNPASKN